MLLEGMSAGFSIPGQCFQHSAGAILLTSFTLFSTHGFHSLVIPLIQNNATLESLKQRCGYNWMSASSAILRYTTEAYAPAEASQNPMRLQCASPFNLAGTEFLKQCFEANNDRSHESYRVVKLGCNSNNFSLGGLCAFDLYG